MVPEHFVALLLPFVVFWIGKVVEVIVSGGGAAAVAKGTCKATGACLIGLVGFLIMLASVGWSSGDSAE